MLLVVVFATSSLTLCNHVALATMKKSTSLCEFSTTPSVSLMRDKTGQNIGAGAQPRIQTNKQEKPTSTAKPGQANQDDEDMFQLEGV
jgi:hypothetical protein